MAPHPRSCGESGKRTARFPWRERWLGLWRRWGPPLLLALSAALLMRGWLLGPLPSSPRQETYAELHLVGSVLADLQEGRLLVAWNPREFTGYPWLRFLAYPVYLVLAGLSHLSGIALTRVMVGFFFLVFWGSGVAMYAYVRALHPGRVAATLAGLVYQWVPCHAHLGVEVWVHAAFWALLPLSLWLVERVVAAGRGPARWARSLALGALLAALVVVTIEYTMLAAPFLAVYILAREAALVRSGRESLAGSLARLTAMAAVALGLAAFFVWPALTSVATVGIHAKHAAGSTFSDELLRGYAVTPSLALYAIARRTHLHLPYGQLPAIASSAWSAAWYPGLVAPALGALGLVAAGQRRRWGLVVVLLGLAAMMALGPNLPGNPFPRLPGLGRLSPFRALLFVAAFGSVLAGLGGAWLVARLRVSRPWRAALVGLVGLALVGDYWPATSAFVGVERYFSPAEEAAHEWLRARAEGGYRYWEPTALPRDDYRAILDVTRTGMPRFWGYYDNGAPLYAWQAFNGGDLAVNLRLSSTRYALLDRQMAADPGNLAVLERAGFERVDWGGQELCIFADPEPLPYARAYPAVALCVGVEPARALSLVPALHEKGVALVSGQAPRLDDYSAEALAPYTCLLADGAASGGYGERLLAADGLARLPGSPIIGGERVRWQRPHPGVVRVEVDLEERAVVTIAEAWYPHWRVTVDGVSAPLLRVNYCYQGAWVPAGRHQVVFRYCSPACDRLALWLSGATALGLVVALWALRGCGHGWRMR